MGERNHSKGPKEGFHHKYQDIALKGVQMEFEKGDKPFSFFSDVFDHLPAIESVEPNELSKVVTVEASADVVFRLQDGIFVNIENQSTYSDNNRFRFHVCCLIDRSVWRRNEGIIHNRCIYLQTRKGSEIYNRNRKYFL